MTNKEAFKNLVALNAVCGQKDYFDKEFEEALLVAEKALEQEPRWIPVSERLPEDGQNVLFCDNDGYIMVGYHIKGRTGTHFSQDGTYEDMKNVRAWMPLPEHEDDEEGE